jgi:long-subunit acyl-CoA synthetase (AMP-forming)
MNELMHSCGSPVAVTSGYGLSETFSVCTVDYQPGVYDKDYSKRAICVGYAFPGTEVGIFDENGKELGYGERGEVWVKTASMTTGYINDPELNAEKLKDGWLHTGDYGEIDRSGMLFVYGRMAQHILAPDGSTVYLFDISNELRQDKAVKNALVCLLEVKDGPAPLVAHIVLENNVQEPEEQILLRLDKRMKKFLPEGLSIQGYRLEHGQLKSILVGKTDRHYYATLFSGYRIPRDGGIKVIDFD